MADYNQAAEELLLDVRVAEASAAYKFYLNHEKAILGSLAVVVAVTSQQFRLCGSVQFVREIRSKPVNRHLSVAAASSISVVCFQ